MTRDLITAARVGAVEDLISYLEASLQHLLAHEEWARNSHEEIAAARTWREVQETATEHRRALDKLLRDRDAR